MKRYAFLWFCILILATLLLAACGDTPAETTPAATTTAGTTAAQTTAATTTAEVTTTAPQNLLYIPFAELSGYTLTADEESRPYMEWLCEALAEECELSLTLAEEATSPSISLSLSSEGEEYGNNGDGELVLSLEVKD